MTTREQALEWWNNLPDLTITTEINKSALTKKYKGQFRMYASLTGEEIEFIFSREVEPQSNIYLDRLRQQYKLGLEKQTIDSWSTNKMYYDAMRLFCLDTQLVSFEEVEGMESSFV